MEPNIIINGTELSAAQAMTLRVAVACWLMELDDANERALLGSIADLYRRSLTEIQGYMFTYLRRQL